MRSFFQILAAAILFAGAAGAEVRVATGDALKAAVKKVNPDTAIANASVKGSRVRSPSR